MYIASVRRLARLMDTVDNLSEHMWFFDRWAIYHEKKQIPGIFFDEILKAKGADHKHEHVDKECNLMIPAKSVIWAKKNVLSEKFEGYGCDPSSVASNTVFVSPDMISDHICEQYEDALDALLEQY